MAERRPKEEEHAFQRIEKDIRGDALKSPLIFHGREQYLIDWALNAIEQKYINPACRELDLSLLDPATLTFDSLRDCCETLPMLSEKRLVIAPDFAALHGKAMKAFSPGDEAALTEYLSDLPDSCILILTNEQVDKRLKLYKAAAAAGAAYDFSALGESQLRSFINKRLKQAGKTASAAVVNQLIELSGYYEKESEYTLYNLENDLRKAVAHASGEELRAGDITDTVSGNLDTDVFALIDALSRNRKDAAFQKLHDLLVSGANHYQLLALICSQFELILKLRELKSEGRTPAEMNSRLGVNEYRLRKTLSFVERYTVPQLRRILLRAYSVDKNIKEGLLDSTLALEMFIAEM